MLGRVKRLVRDRGFGFIKGDDNLEYFFHRSAVPKDIGFDNLTEGDRVQFAPEDGTKGLRAEDVERA